MKQLVIVKYLNVKVQKKGKLKFWTAFHIKSHNFVHFRVDFHIKTQITNASIKMSHDYREQTAVYHKELQAVEIFLQKTACTLSRLNIR